MLFFILLSTILFFFCLYLYFDNKKLKQKIIDLELETKTILERKLIYNKEDLISIENISIEKPKEIEEEKKNNHKTNNKNQSKELTNIIRTIPKYTARTNEEEIIVPKMENPITPTLTKNTSSSDTINIKQSTDNYNQNYINNISISECFNPIEFIKNYKKEEIITNNKIDRQTDNEYLENVAKQIEKELIPQTIDLTEYEKNQEEQAIISYQELLSLKEKNKNESKQNASLLQDLKEFRKLLD